MFKERILSGGIFELPALFRGKKLSAPYRHIASAFKGDPREPESVGDIFVVNDNEYLVPGEEKFEKGHLTEITVRLDQAQLILERPGNTRQILNMSLSKDIPESVRAILSKAVKDVNPTHFDYAVKFIQPQP